MADYVHLNKKKPRVCDSRRFFCLLVIAFVLLWMFNNAVTRSLNLASVSAPLMIWTAKGNVSIEELTREVFVPNGYELVSANQHIIPVLREVNPATCKQVFDNWSKQAENSISVESNPQITLRADYTLNGYTTMSDCFINETFNNDPSYVERLSQQRLWSTKHIDTEVAKTRNQTFSNYTYEDSLAVYYATKFHSIAGKDGAVIGSQSPWVEVLCLANGAKSLITVDYQKLHITHSQISFVQAMDMAKNSKTYTDKFDFVVSFSSIEHSGLGRYGDPIDPFGDVKEVQKIHCMLKPGGLLFLGVPVGWDDVGYNCHRIYGRLRLAIMTAGFELLNTFYTEENPIEIKLDRLTDESRRVVHYVFVLKKAQ